MPGQFQKTCLKKNTNAAKIFAMRWRVEFFKDLVGSEGRAFSSLQQSVVIDRADNGDHAVEAAKRWYEQLCRVPIWSLYADRLELESEGKRICYHPTRDEIALTRIPGRDQNTD
jgi:hypothetical protein